MNREGAGEGELFLDYLNGPDVARLALTDDEILAAVEAGLRAQGRGETVIEPRVHLAPGPPCNGHFNVLRGYVAPLELAGVKVVGDYVDNYQPRPAVRNGPAQPVRSGDGRGRSPIIDAAGTHRHAHRRRHGDRREASRAPGEHACSAHIGARGTAYWNVRLLDRLFDFDEIRVHSRRPESRDALRRATRAAISASR